MEQETNSQDQQGRQSLSPCPAATLMTVRAPSESGRHRRALWCDSVAMMREHLWGWPAGSQSDRAGGGGGALAGDLNWLLISVSAQGRASPDTAAVRREAAHGPLSGLLWKSGPPPTLHLWISDPWAGSAPARISPGGRKHVGCTWGAPRPVGSGPPPVHTPVPGRHLHA